MQRTARCRGLWWFKFSRNNSFLHTSVLSKEKTQVQASCQPSTPDQEPPNSSSEEKYQHIEQLRQRNCWKLWELRGLLVEEISCILHMRQDTIINIILSFERKRENVNWCRLCKLVMLTTTTAQAILVATSKAKREISSSCGANLFSASDIKSFCPQNVTLPHIYLVHMMLGRKLTSSEILSLASFTDLDFKGTYQAEGTDSDPQSAENTANASLSPGETATNTAFPEYNGKIKYGSGEEIVDSVRPISIARYNKVTIHKEYDVFLNTRLGANDHILASKVCQEEKDTAVFRNMDYEYEGGKNLGFYHQTAVTGQKLVTTFDILQWLRYNDMATISNIVNAFRYCEAKHLLFLLLEMLESSIIVEQDGMLRIALEQSASRLEEPMEKALSNALIERRMHRALCLKAVVLNVAIHEPKANVEFIIRHIKADNESTVYNVQICKYPSCTCPDFLMRFKAGMDYMPCKHLFYVYLVQLHIEKNLEHIMLERTLKEEELERILEGHY